MSKNISHKIALMQLGITQRQIARMLHYSESYVSMLISGERKNERFDKFLELLTTSNGNNEVIG